MPRADTSSGRSTPRRVNNVLSALVATLAFSWLMAGLLRGLAGVLLNALLEHGLYRLVAPELVRGWFSLSFLATVLLAGVIVCMVAVLFWRSGANTVLVGGISLLVFWLALGIHEIVTFTRFQDVVKNGWRLSPAHLWILALAAGFGLAAFALWWTLRQNLGRGTIRLLAISLALVLLVGLGLPALPAPSANDATTRPNLLLITVDTLRADHLSSYGYERLTTPNLDALAARGIRYSRSISQAPHTHPSMASMLTSAYPTALGGELKYIPYNLPTVSEVLLNAGYQTAAVSSNAWIKRALGFDQGFAHFDQTSAMSEFYADNARIDWKDASHVSDAGLAWLDAHHGDERPFFLWLHYLDPHHPYDPSDPHSETFVDRSRPKPPFVEELNTLPTGEQTERLLQLADVGGEEAEQAFDAIRELYDGEIAYTDMQIGRVLDHLESLGLSDNTAVVFTSDHGEEFLDHGQWGHSHTLFDELIHVPLILSYPGHPNPGVVRDNVVRTLDLAPTLLEIAGLDIPKSMRGRSLLLLERRRPPSDPPALSVLSKKRQLSIEVDGWKLIYSPREDKAQLFNLREDPDETVDLADLEAEQRKLMIAALIENLGSLPRWVNTEVRDHMLDQATREQLKALGYVQ